MTASAILRIHSTGEDVSPVTMGEKRRADRTSSNLTVLDRNLTNARFSMKTMTSWSRDGGVATGVIFVG